MFKYWPQIIVLLRVKLELVNAKGKTAKEIATEFNRSDLLPFLNIRSNFKDNPPKEVRLSTLPQGFFSSLDKLRTQDQRVSDSENLREKNTTYPFANNQ